MTDMASGAKYRAVKGAITLQSEEGQEYRGFFYALIDNGNVYRFGLRMLAKPESSLTIKSGWVEFCTFVEAKDPSEDTPLAEQVRIPLHRTLLDTRLVTITPQGAIAVQELEKTLNDAAAKTVRGMRSHTFLKVENCTDKEFRLFLEQFETKEQKKADRAAKEEFADGEDATPEGEPLEEPKTREVTLVCQPIIDPIHGKSAVSLVEGDVMIVRLPEDSAIFSILSKAKGGLFDGAVEGQVLKVERHSEDALKVEVHLSEGVRGIVGLKDQLRLKMARTRDAAANGGAPSGADQKKFIMLLAGGVALFLAVAAFLFLR